MAAPVEQVAAIPLFSDLDNDTQAHIAKWFDERVYDAGQTVVRAGSDGYSFFVLVSGTLTVLAPNEKVVALRPGDFFGEIGMIDRGPGTATVTTLTAGHFFVMSHAQFRDAIKANDSLMVKVLRVMGERLRDDLSESRRKR